MKYLDLSSNNLDLPRALKLLGNVDKNLDFVNLAHNQLGEVKSHRALTKEDVINLVGKINVLY